MNAREPPKPRAGHGLLLTEARLYAGCCTGALWRAAAHGGDSDSTASIAGNLLGAQLSAAALPPRCCEQVEVADLIARVARDLRGAALGERTFDAADYPSVTGVVAGR